MTNPIEGEIMTGATGSMTVDIIISPINPMVEWTEAEPITPTVREIDTGLTSQMKGKLIILMVKSMIEEKSIKNMV